MRSNSDLVLLFSRILISLIFLMSGFQKITNYGGTADKIASQGVPLAMIAAGVAILLELLGGLSVLTGYQSQSGAWLLVVFTVLATVLFHDFWNFPEEKLQGQMIHFLKNLSIIGGLLVLTVTDPGAYSLGND